MRVLGTGVGSFVLGGFDGLGVSVGLLVFVVGKFVGLEVVGVDVVVVGKFVGLEVVGVDVVGEEVGTEDGTAEVGKEVGVAVGADVTCNFRETAPMTETAFSTATKFSKSLYCLSP